MSTDRYWQKWLPAPLQDAAKEEPARFAALVQELAARVAVAKASQEKNAWHSAVVPLIPALTAFIDLGDPLPVKDVLVAVHNLLEVVLNTSHDVEVQVRTAGRLSDLLIMHKKELSGRPAAKTGSREGAQPTAEEEDEGGSAAVPPPLVLPWRPLFNLMVSLFGSPAPRLEGLALGQARLAELYKLVSRCRRYFEPGALFEVWSVLQPAVSGVGTSLGDAYEALGWLALFAPTHNICRCDPAAVNRLVSSWVSHWTRLSNSPSWSALWAGLLGRAAKDDWKGIIDWGPHTSALFTHFIAAFDVPVGSATSAHNTHRPAPAKALILHSSNMGGIYQHVARLQVALLRTCPQRPHTHATAAAALPHLRQLAGLLDNYLHPSNTGKWSRDLASWVKHLASELLKQLGHQGPVPPPWRASLAEAERSALASIITQLAARAQFSKDPSLASAACGALGRVAYVAPATVLPLAFSRFRSALNSANAAQQLPWAIGTLATCVRPMLLSGWGPGQGGEEVAGDTGALMAVDDTEPGMTGPQVIAEALLAVLPGLDANDENKTLATVYFITSVLASGAVLGEGEEVQGVPSDVVRIPLYVEEWSEELLSRVFTLLQSLDSGPGHRSDDALAGAHAGHESGGGGGSGGAAFLTMTGSHFPQMMQHLLARLPPAISSAMAARIARFAATENLPGVERSVGAMLTAATHHHPDVVVTQMLRPTLLALTSELGAPGASSDTAPSKALEATLCYQLSLVREAVFALPPSRVLGLAGSLVAAADAAIKVPSRPVQNAASSLLSAVVCGLSRHWCTPASTLVVKASAQGAGEGGRVEEWVDKEGADVPPLEWELVSPEAVQVAERLVSSHALAALNHLASLLGVGPSGAGSQPASAPGQHALRMAIHSDLCKIKGVLAGLLSSLHDFNLPPSPAGSTPISIAGGQGPVIGQAGTREQLAEVLTALGPALQGYDTETLGEYLAVVGLVLCPGTLEHSTAQALSNDVRKAMSSMSEPAAAALLLTPGSEGAARPWRKRVARWVAVMKVSKALTYRSAQNSFWSWTTTSRPVISSAAEVPAPIRALMGALLPLITHPLKPVRSEAMPLLDSITTRFPCLARPVLPFILAAMADAPLSVAPTPSSTPVALTNLALLPPDQAAAIEAQVLTAVAAAAANNTPQSDQQQGPAQGVAGAGAAAQEGGAAGGAGSLAQESAREGRVAGAAQVFSHCINMHRQAMRDASLFSGMLLALMASRSYNSTRAQQYLSEFMIGLASRFLVPSTLTPESPQFRALADQILALAKPEALRSSWRYTLIANVLLLMLMPAPSTGSPALPFLRHLLSLLAASNMLQLRTLAAGGVMLVVMQMVESGNKNEDVVSEISSWLSSSPSVGQALAAHLVSDHSTLEQAEASSDKRGAGLMALAARMLNMTHEELILKVLQASMDRLQRWPESGTPEWQPEAIRDGLFVVNHAKLVSLLGAVAPGPLMAALKEPLDKWAETAARQQVAHTHDKAEQAAAAEVMAGLLASGAPWAAPQAGTSGSGSGSDTRTWFRDLLARQLASSSLEMSEAWAVSLRYGVRGLVDMCVPPAGLYLSPGVKAVMTTPLPKPLITLPQETAVPALGVVVETILASGPPAAAPAPPAAGAGSSTPPPAGTAAAQAPSGDVSTTVGGSSTPATLKRLRYIHQVARELTALSPARGLPAPVRRFWGSLLRELRGALTAELLSLRQQLGKMMGLSLGYFSATGAAARGAVASGGRGSPVPTRSGVPGGNGNGNGNSSGVEESPIKVDPVSGEEAPEVEMGEEGSYDVEDAAVMVVGASPSVSDLQAEAEALANAVVAAFADATATVQALRQQQGAGSESEGPSGLGGGGLPRPAGTSSSSLSGAGAAGGDDMVMIDKPQGPGTPPITEVSSPQSREGSPPPPTSSAASGLALSRVGTGLGLLNWAAYHGDLARLRPLLLAMLPHLLRLQELAGPVLQKLEHDAKLALVLVKYLPPSPSFGAELVVGAIQGAAGPSSVPPAGSNGGTAAAAGGELWSTRGAALALLQYFWFRSVFLLSQAQAATLEEVVLGRLSDPKPEVRAAAGATLSGMVRGMSPKEADALRQKLIKRANQLFTTSSRSRQAAAAAPSDPAAAAQLLLEKHGVVQGLKAFLQSAPYDCPPWVPSVLLALLRPANAGHGMLEAAVRTAAAKALSEFKRTHEQDSLDALKAMVSADEWDSLQQATSSGASYFT